MTIPDMSAYLQFLISEHKNHIGEWIRNDSLGFLIE